MISAIAQWADQIIPLFLQYGPIGLFILSIGEVFILPVPPDAVLIPMSLLNPSKALWYGFITIAGSATGSVMGYYIGKWAGRPVLARMVKPDMMQRIEDLLSEHGSMAALLIGFSPIPDKPFTIAAGIFRINIVSFVIWLTISRSIRFMSEVLAIIFFGETAVALVQQYFGPISAAICIIVVIAVAFRYRMKAREKNF
ncbi:YqaA family protein [Mahella australiensis]|uniref:SNARE associated Golgi protein-related protein n=1 Tax=Mahella australiensis (strain DSM 15567 / CIP 107919 / 50-1 BON) TaxID=697281 RepID=F4A2G0_MAHA5|nr:VTT domain-containing protein [Mahella australiensis]AEE97226.1 SNARE associated Golgi protein-related protein [Mahella australiensis 50-1 BON]